ncbi:MAG: phosphatase PAP2 family protein [Myxococcaceae bacterium]|nr:phosphatase PAP2 family protein [Myxococcaceae bacterium]
MKRLLPLEWGLLAFIVYVVLRSGPTALARWEELSLLRSVNVFAALLVVGALHLLRRDLRTPFKEPPEPRQKALLDGTLLIASLPFVMAAYLRFIRWDVIGAFRRSEASDAVAGLGLVILQVLSFGAPTLIVWAAVATHFKQHGRIVWPKLLRESLAGAARMAREWSPVLLLLAAYPWMAAVIGDPPRSFDATMTAIDRALFFGVDPLDALQAIISVPLTEGLALSYTSYMLLYPLCMGAVFMTGDVPALRELATALGLALVVAYVGYSLVPVMGPSLARTFDVPLQYWVMESVKTAAMDDTRITYDCFPSFHTAGTVILAWGTWRHARRLAVVLAPIIVTIPFACVYLRYHYVADVIAGLALAAVACVFTPRLLARWSTAP